MEKINAALVAIAVLLMPLSASAQYSYPGTDALPDSRTYRVKDNVAGGFLNMREGPGAHYDVMTRIPAGMGGIVSKNKCVRPKDKSSRYPFCQVEWHKFQGWMSSIWLEPEGEEQR